MKTGSNIVVTLLFAFLGILGLALIGIGFWQLLDPGGSPDILAWFVGSPEIGVPTVGPIAITPPGNATVLPGQLVTATEAPTSKPTITLSPTPLTPWNACPNAYQSRFRVGMTGSVSTNPPLPNNVRDQASKQGKLLGSLKPGDSFKIIEGPGCSNNWVWWKVQASSSNLVGWTAEGDGVDYWLVPNP